MGRDKSQIVWKGHTWLEHTLARLKQAHISALFISGDDQAGGIVDSVKGAGPIGGMYSVLQTLKNNDVAGAVFVPVDMPAFEVANIEQLVSEGLKNSRAVFFSEHYLPVYLPNSKDTCERLFEVLHSGNRSIGHLLDTLDAMKIYPVKPTGFNNINTEQEWLAFDADTQ